MNSPYFVRNERDIRAEAKSSNTNSCAVSGNIYLSNDLTTTWSPVGATQGVVFVGSGTLQIKDSAYLTSKQRRRIRTYKIR